MQEPTLTFSGPYSLVPSGSQSLLYDVAEAQQSGLYLWTIKVSDGYLVNYVGMTTKPFKDRFHEHLRYYLAGDYIIYDDRAFLSEVKTPVYKPSGDVCDYIRLLPSIAEKMVNQLQTFSIFLAPHIAPKMTLERIESALITRLRTHSTRTSEFLDNMRVSRYVQEADHTDAVLIQSEHMLAGLSGAVISY